MPRYTNIASSELLWRAGLAKVCITPQTPVWMAGYSSRTRPAEGVAQDLYAKALALEEPSGERLIMVTTDLLGLPAHVSKKITTLVEGGYNLTRDHLLLTSSHTHGGPVINRMLAVAYDMTPEQWSKVRAYSSFLEDAVVAVVGEALRQLAPARLTFGHAETTFGVNRRVKTDHSWIIGVNRDGPVDSDVPVLRIDGQEGKTKGLVFGYACHNTAAKEFMRFNGDYAGFAQAWLENRYPGSVALFVAGCGADINPHPRGSIELAREHGERLAAAVDESIKGPLKVVEPSLASAFAETSLPFAVRPTRKELMADLQSDNVYRQRWAKAMLVTLDREGHIPDSYPYPVQVWRLGSSVILIALAGEVVVDYAQRLKKEFASQEVWPISYCNDVFAYIPSLRVLQEGGYEGGDAMVYYGQPGPFAPLVEDMIVEKVHELFKAVRSTPSYK